MKNTACHFFALVILIFSSSCKKQITDAFSEIEWSKTFGGSGLDYPYAAAEGKNKSYVIVGYTTSSDSNVNRKYCRIATGQNAACKFEDAWIINIDINGSIIKQYTFPGPISGSQSPGNSDRATSVIYNPLEDTWLVAGQTNSTDDLHSSRFILKLNSSGDSVESYIIRPNISSDDSVSFITSTTTPNLYVLTGSTLRDRFHNNYLGYLDAINTVNRSSAPIIGTSVTDGRSHKFNSVIQIKDGSYVAVGQCNTFVGSAMYHSLVGYDTSWDMYLMKYSANNIVNYLYGGEANDVASSVLETADGGLIIAGQTNSIGQDIDKNHSNKYDAWVVKLDKNFKIEWQKTYGGAFGDELVKSMVRTLPDSGYVIAGQTTSNDGDVSGNHGNSDAWIFKIDKKGNLLWQKTLGGSGADGATNVITTSDGGLLVTGYSFSYDGDVPENSSYGCNFWVVKLRRQ